MSADDLEEYDVAVVVLLRATGHDYGDATDRASAAVRAALRDNAQVVSAGPRGAPVLEVPRDLAEQNVTVAGVVELSTAFGNGYVAVVRPGRRFFRDRGFEPLPGQEDD